MKEVWLTKVNKKKILERFIGNNDLWSCRTLFEKKENSFLQLSTFFCLIQHYIKKDPKWQSILNTLKYTKEINTSISHQVSYFSECKLPAPQVPFSFHMKKTSRYKRRTPE